MIVAVLGIQKAGGAYVPLDPGYPKTRITYMLEDSGVSCVVTQASLKGSLPAGNRTIICLDDDAVKKELQGFGSKPIQGETNGPGPDHLAHVIYTSGSTGNPKGVAIEHHSVFSLLNWARLSFPEHAKARVLFSTSVCFDLSVFEIWLPLISGGTVVLVENILDLIEDPDLAPSLINTVPSAVRALIEQKYAFGGTSIVNLAGEPLPNELVRKIYRFGHIEAVYNLYGPSETTTYSTYARIPRDFEGVPPIGKPVDHTHVYVLSPRLKPVPIGMAGELYIGGAGVSRGYLNQPELTNERFIKNPFKSGSERLYKTGDLVRWVLQENPEPGDQPTGNLEFLGRIDHQVKLRGFRIELGEIEAALSEFDGVAEAVALVRGDQGGDKQLVAYVRPEKDATLSASDLGQHLKQVLPDYMVPSAFGILEAFPMTPNGKIDRKALPSPNLRRSQKAYVAPQTPEEKTVVAIWEDLLGGHESMKIGIHDNFFELGGHSLLALQATSRTGQVLGLSLEIKTIFFFPTVHEFAKALGSARKMDDALPMIRVNREEPLPLSFSQQRLWFLYQLEGKSPTYNIPAAVRLSVSVNVEALRRSFQALVQRHEVFRTRFVEEQMETFQVIDKYKGFEIIERKISEDEIEDCVQANIGYCFDLTTGPLLRVELLQLDEQDYVLLINAHHIISDEWSYQIMIGEVMFAYGKFAAGEDYAPTEPLYQYADYASWQRQYLSGDRLAEQEGYWTKQLAGLPPLLELPTDRPRPVVQSFNGAVSYSILPKEIALGMKDLSDREGATLFMIYLAAFQVLLAKYSGQPDIAVGTPIANRTRMEVESMLGFFVNSVVLRSQVEPELNFKDLLAQVKTTSLEAFSYQELPFEHLVSVLKPERNSSHSPLFQVMFSYQGSSPGNVSTEDFDWTVLDQKLDTAKFDLTLSVEVTAKGTLCYFEYNTDLFNASTIKRMGLHFETLLGNISRDPAQPISHLGILGKKEKGVLLDDWNAASLSWSGKGTKNQLPVSRLFEAQVKKAPKAKALSYLGESMTYEALNKRANQMARLLRDRGVKRNRRIGICLDRSLDLVVAVMATLKAGGAYIPLDPGLPQDRLKYMLEDSQPAVLITKKELFSAEIELELETVDLEQQESAIAAQNDANLDAKIGRNDLAYIIYTSGSTGRPKGVMVGHGSLSGLFFALKEKGLVSASIKSFLQMANFSFDVFTEDFVRALCSGAKLVLCPREVLLEPQRLGGTD